MSSLSQTIALRCLKERLIQANLTHEIIRKSNWHPMQAKGMIAKTITVCGVLLPISIIIPLRDPTVRDVRKHSGFISVAKFGDKYLLST